MRGTLTKSSGSPLFGFVLPVGANFSGQIAQTSARTGAYALGGLASGTYRLWFQPDDRSFGPGGWFTNLNVTHFTQSRAKATLVTVLHDRANINVRMPRLYTMSGTVRDAAGQPLAWAWVSVGGSEAPTNAHGRYTVRGLVAGRYAVTVWPPRNGDEQRAWYSTTAPGHAATTAAGATRVTVGPSRTAIDLRLPLGYSIAGCVALPPDVQAIAYAERPGPRTWPYLDLSDKWYSDWLDATTGCYEMTGLPAGSWVVRINADQPAADGYYTTGTATHYTPDRSKASLVTVGP